MVGYNLPPLIEIGLTDLLQSGWAIAHPTHPSPTLLHSTYFATYMYDLI